jgi:hypothetical protein
MKSSLITKMAIGALVISSLAACGTPVGNTVPATPQEFFNANGVATQIKNISVGTAPVTVTFEKGTALTFANDSIVNTDGTPFTGNVVLSVREIVSKADMVLSNVLAVSNPSQIGTTPAIPAPLVSGGMFSLDIKTPAGTALNINPAKGVGAAVPIQPGAKPNDVMQQFTGSQSSCASEPHPSQSVPIAPGDSSVNWCPVAGQFGINTTTAPGSYVFSVFNKGWINCDFFYSDPRAKTTLRVTFDPINDANTVVFMIPQGINTVIALYTKDGLNKRKSYDNLVPIGLNTELVALTFDNGKQYLAHKTITVGGTTAAGPTENLTFIEASTADIKAYLTPLN